MNASPDTPQRRATAQLRQSLVFGLVVVPNFSLIALSACVDPLRLANQVLGRAAYRSVLLSVEGGLVASSDGIEVIEIGVPAEHVTEIDHVLTLPTSQLRPEREWQGQRFVHNVGTTGEFRPFRLPGFVARDTTINANTKGVASVMVAKPDGQEKRWTVHHGDILFTFVMKGTMVLEGEGMEPFTLSTGDAFAIPPGFKTRYSAASGDLELLEVSLPGVFSTEQL